MNLNDPSGRLYPPPTGATGPFPGQAPRAFPPSFPSNFPTPPAQNGPSALPPRLQLQMLLQISLTGQQQQQQQHQHQHQQQQQQQLQSAPNAPAGFSNMPSLLDAQPSYRPSFAQPPPFQPGSFSQPPPSFNRPGLLSGGQSTSSIPGLGDTQDLERLRALENALKEASRGSWQPPGVTPRPAVPMMHPPGLPRDAHDEAIARRAEAFIRELQSRSQIFDYGHHHEGFEPAGRRRRRSSSSSNSSSEGGYGQKKRRDEDSDLEEGEVQDDVPDTGFLHNHNAHFQANLPPPLFGSNPPTVPPPFIPPMMSPDEGLRERDTDRGRDRRRNKNYRDLDAQEEIEDNSHGGGKASGAPGDKGGGKNSFDQLFSAYLSHKAKTTKEEAPPAPQRNAQPSPPPSIAQPVPSQATDSIAPLLKTLGPSIQQALNAVGIHVPSSMGPQAPIQQQSVPIASATAPSLSCALSAFDRDIAQLGGVVPQQMVPRSLGAGLPTNVTVEVAGDSSELATTAAEIAAQVDKPGDLSGAQQKLPREVFPNRDNRATVACVQKMVPLIPMVERENVAQRAAEGPDYTATPLLLPVRIIEEHIFPPMKDSAGRANHHRMMRRGFHGEAVAPGWSKSELHDKVRQARERVNHLKIEQGMVEERLAVMSDELRTLHRYFESNYGVNLVRPADLEDPPELVALRTRREEEARKKEQEAGPNELNSELAAIDNAVQLVGDESNQMMPDENGGEAEEGMASPMEEERINNDASEAAGPVARPLTDEANRKRKSRRHGEHWRGGKPRSNMRSRVHAPDGGGGGGGSHRHGHHHHGGHRKGGRGRGGRRH